MDEPLFSVLIANYNNGQFLQEAIDSVLAQAYTNWEIVLVDDKSSDNSFEIYEKYKNDSRFHIFYNEENKGCGYTKHRCAELSSGEICGFLDPDDLLLPEALTKHVKVHVSNPDTAVVYSRCYDCNSNGEILCESGLLKLKKGETFFDYRWLGPMHFTSYKKRYYDKTEGISQHIKAGVDHDLYFKIEETGKIFFLNEFTYKYIHRNKDAVTRNKGMLWYWNMEVRRAACRRRGLDEDTILSQDWDYIIKQFEEAAANKKMEQIRNTRAFRLGKIILKPFYLLKKIIY